MMRPVFVILISLIFLTGTAYAEINTVASNWHVKKSEHFIINYQEAPAEYVDRVAEKAEYYYNSIVEELGFTRFEGFWTWDKRAIIYLFTSADEYQKITNQPGWSAAGTNVSSRQIYTFINMENFFDVILPHEITHIVFREFVGNTRVLPLWMDEGIACYMEKARRQDRLRIAKAIVKSKLFIPLKELERVNRIYLLIIPDIFYAEAASVIEFLIADYGRDKFMEFCRKLRDLRVDQSWEVALLDEYNFKDLDELNTRWNNFLFDKGK